MPHQLGRCVAPLFLAQLYNRSRSGPIFSRAGEVRFSLLSAVLTASLPEGRFFGDSANADFSRLGGLQREAARPWLRLCLLPLRGDKLSPSQV